MSEYLHDLSFAQLEAVCEGLGEPVWRAAQIWHWLYVRYAEDWESLKNLPRSLREALAYRFSLVPLKSEELSQEQAGGVKVTKKISAQLTDGEIIETVLIPAVGKNLHLRQTVCVSTQAGCKFRCAFCASGKAGFKRNLSAGEILAQVLIFTRFLGKPPSNVVFMGIGEPFDNYDHVLSAIRVLNHPDGLNIGARRITISTCGVIPGIQRLAQEGLQVELSVSLHAPSNALRSKLMPVNRHYPLADLLAACNQYAEQTGRIVTFEYTLLDQINASAEHAGKLAKILRGIPCKVNLIPLSPIEELNAKPPAWENIHRFMQVLERSGVNSTLRASRGSEIHAACGQLRLNRLKQK